MPKTDSSSVDNPGPESERRRSTRSRRMVGTYKDDLPNEVLSEVLKGAEPEIEMPAGWGASDDSEDDYKPSPNKTKILHKTKIVDSSDLSDDDDVVVQKQKRKRPRFLSSSKKPRKRDKTVSKETVHDCLLCGGGRSGGDRLFLEASVGEARCHYAECYYRCHSEFICHFTK